MSIKAIIDKLDDAPEALRSFYQAGTAEAGAEGKFVLKVEPVGGWSLEDVGGLKSALGKERTSREDLERQVVKFKDLDPDKARAALTELEELKKLDPAKEADKLAQAKIDAATKQLVEKHQAEVGDRDTRISALTKAVDGFVREAAATAALAEAKGSVELLLPHVLKHTRTTEKDGKFILEVVDAEGNVRIADGKATPMDLKGLVAEMKQNEAFARAFDGEGHTGSGKQPDKGGKATPGGEGAERARYYAQKHGLPVS